MFKELTPIDRIDNLGINGIEEEVIARMHNAVELLDVSNIDDLDGVQTRLHKILELFKENKILRQRRNALIAEWTATRS